MSTVTPTSPRINVEDPCTPHDLLVGDTAKTEEDVTGTPPTASWDVSPAPRRLAARQDLPPRRQLEDQDQDQQIWSSLLTPIRSHILELEDPRWQTIHNSSMLLSVVELIDP